MRVSPWKRLGFSAVLCEIFRTAVRAIALEPDVSTKMRPNGLWLAKSEPAATSLHVRSLLHPRGLIERAPHFVPVAQEMPRSPFAMLISCVNLILKPFGRNYKLLMGAIVVPKKLITIQASGCQRLTPHLLETAY